MSDQTQQDEAVVEDAVIADNDFFDADAPAEVGEFDNLDDPIENEDAVEDGEGEAGKDGEDDNGEEKPVTLKVGDAEVPLAEAETRLAQFAELEQEVAWLYEGEDGKGQVDWKDLAMNGESYKAAMVEMETPEGAEKVINALVASAVAKHGAQATNLDPIDLRDFDPAQLTGVSLRLYGAIKHKEAEVQSVLAKNQELVRIARDAQAKLAEYEQNPVLVQQVKAKYANADVTAEGLRGLMQKHGVGDPVKAYALELIETNSLPVGEPKAKRNPAPGAAPRAPKRAAGTETFNPEGMSVAQIMAAREKGAVPVKA